MLLLLNGLLDDGKRPPVVAQKYELVHANLANDLFQPLIERRHEHLPPVFGTPDPLLVTSREHVAFALVGRLIHTISIQHRALSVKSVCSRVLEGSPRPHPQREHPLHLHRGIIGAFGGGVR
jgi:hypothetical protein